MDVDGLQSTGLASIEAGLFCPRGVINRKEASAGILACGSSSNPWSTMPHSARVACPQHLRGRRQQRRKWWVTYKRLLRIAFPLSFVFRILSFSHLVFGGCLCKCDGIQHQELDHMCAFCTTPTVASKVTIGHVGGCCSSNSRQISATNN
jgi:hypothetical protein